MKKWIRRIVEESLIIAMPTFVVGLFLMIPVFFAGWYSGYHTAYKRGKNMGYVEGYKSVAKEFSEARDKYFEASIELKVALMDLMEYKLKLQEKEGNK